MRRHSRHLLWAMFIVAVWVVACAASGDTLDRDRIRVYTLQHYGAPGVQVLEEWLQMLQLARSQPRSVQLTRVNEFVNLRTTFTTDWDAWGQEDYWATPLQTLMKGKGDCEDFVIAKYFSLLTLGVPQEQLRLIYVKADLDGQSQAHMVLGYYATPDAVPLILDNLQGVIAPASERPDLTPVFSFNGQGLWAGNQRAPGDPTARLSRWRDLLSRAREEGFQ